MNLIKLAGKTFSKLIHNYLRGIDIKIIQVINPGNSEPVGKQFFAGDPFRVKISELVPCEKSFQVEWTFEENMIPISRAITTIISPLNLTKEEEYDIG